MTEKTVGIGVIGLGMGANLLYVNREPDSRLEVRGLCATNMARTARLAKEWQIPFWTDDYRDLLARDDIQAIGVFSPDPLHAEHALAALTPASTSSVPSRCAPAWTTRLRWSRRWIAPG
jgi:predicted dehydrogenase